MNWRAKFAPLALALVLPAIASAQQKIVNGGFEAGLSGWNVANGAGGSGDFYLSSSTTSPASGATTPGAHSGTYYALTDQGGPGAHALYQVFTLGSPSSSAMLSFWYFNQDQSAAGPLGAQNDFTFGAGPNQHVQIDLLGGDISGNPFGGTVLANFFTGAGTFGWTQFSQDISAYLGAGTYSLRFAEVDNQLFFQHGVDDVSLDVTAVPEPGTVALVGFGMAAIVGFKRRRRA